LQIKNECRNQVHEKGQKNRLDRLYTTLQTGYKSKLNSKERQERLEFFLTAFHSKTGAGPFIVAIEELLYRQSRSTQYVEWRVESFQFVETGIKDFDATAIELLQNLHCEFKLDEHCITWKCHLDRLECLYLELLIFAYARPIRAKVRAAGTFSFQTVRSIPEKTDFQSYLLWIKGYIQSSVLRSIYS
jgi:hypothetical protein